MYNAWPWLCVFIYFLSLRENKPLIYELVLTKDEIMLIIPASTNVIPNTE